MRPYVICHMCSTVDGKILGQRWGKLAGYKHESDLFETTAASFGIGAWLVGTTTMDEFDGRKTKLPRAKNPIARRDHIANPKATRLAIGADAKGVLRFQENEVGGDHVVLLVTDRVSNDYLAQTSLPIVLNWRFGRGCAMLVESRRLHELPGMVLFDLRQPCGL